MNNVTIPEFKLAKALSSRSTFLVVIESAFVLLINLFALVGNALLCLAIRKNVRLRRNTTNLFIVSLACSDVLMALLCMPLSVGVFIRGQWIYGQLLCQLQGFAFFVLAFVSLETMALVAVNRYLSVTKPALYQRLFTHKRSCNMIVTLWLLCLFYVGIFTILKWPVFVFDPGKAICHIKIRRGPYKTAWNFITLLVFALVPMVTLFVCYWRIFISVRRHNVQTLCSRRAQRGLHAKSRYSMEDIKITKLILGLIGGFSCCWIPSYGLAYAELAYPRISKQRFPQTLWVFLVFSSCAINSVIYGILNRTFRAEILKLITCRKWREIATEDNEMNRL